MSRTRAALVLTLLALPAAAPCADWSLGTHLCIESISSDTRGSGSSTVLALPGNTLTYQPALRLACSDARHARELFLDTGQFYLDEAGSPMQMVMVGVGYQHVFGTADGTSPFANIGIGWFNEGGAAVSATSATYGAGLGVRRVIRDRHGAIRGELRVDRLNEAPAIGRPPLTSIGMRLGFDLWL